MSAELVIAAIFFIVWIVLAIVLGIAYRILRDRERDTRLDQESGLSPALEVIGAGRVNRRQWSRGRGCRISVYEDFFVVSVSSQRIAIPLYRVRDVETNGGPDRLTLRALAEDESLLSVEFRGADAATLAAALRRPGRNGSRTAGRT